MDLVLFGIQGSGKGTQARKLSQEFGYYVFEAGHELRKIRGSRTELGETVKKYIDRGELVPFEIIMQVTEAAVRAQPAEQSILFDGIPRDREQQVSFNRIMEVAGREFRCIEIAVDPEMAFRRILGRAQEEGRADDSDEEKIRRRMELFTEKTRPVIEAYAEKGKLVRINGEGAVDEVYGRLTGELGSQG